MCVTSFSEENMFFRSGRKHTQHGYFVVSRSGSDSTRFLYMNTTPKTTFVCLAAVVVIFAAAAVLIQQNNKKPFHFISFRSNNSVLLTHTHPSIHSRQCGWLDLLSRLDRVLLWANERTNEQPIKWMNWPCSKAHKAIDTETGEHNQFPTTFVSKHHPPALYCEKLVVLKKWPTFRAKIVKIMKKLPAF